MTLEETHQGDGNPFAHLAGLTARRHHFTFMNSAMTRSTSIGTNLRSVSANTEKQKGTNNEQYRVPRNARDIEVGA